MLENQKPSTPVLIEDLGMEYPTEKSKRKYRYGIYKCSCGKEFKAQSAHVKYGSTRSCGCLVIDGLRKISISHELSCHPLYHTWANIHKRTNNNRNKSLQYYGARGIKVCERWLSIENFIEDMHPTFKEGLSIDRIDVNGNYSPDNCRWVTKEIQSRNTRLLMCTNLSGYRGVHLIKSSKRWRALVGVNKKQIHLGVFETAIEAAKAYDAYVIENNLEHTINGV